MASIKTEKDLGDALKNGMEYIEIEGDLTKKVIRIRATGKTAWAIALAAIGIAVASYLSTPTPAAPAATPVGFVATSVAVGSLGFSATSAAVWIALSAGGVGALNKLRKYKLVSQSGNKIILKRK